MKTVIENTSLHVFSVGVGVEVGVEFATDSRLVQLGARLPFEAHGHNLHFLLSDIYLILHVGCHL